MAQRGSDEVGFLLVDGYDLLGVSTQLEDDMEAMTQDGTAFGDTWENPVYTGMKKASLSQQGFFDDDSGSSNAALSGQEGVSRVLCYGVEGNTIGQTFIGYSGAMQVDFVRVASRGDLHRANVTYLGNGVVEEGRIVHEHSAETTASGNTQSENIDDGVGNAPSTDGGSGYLQVSALTLGGYTNVVIKLEDSSDDITYVELIAFTAVTAAPAKQRATVAGNVDRYIAASWAFGGAGAGPSVTFLAGFYRA